MATCDMGYDHDEPVPDPEPVIVAPDSGPNDNDVKIAEIEAAARIETEKIWTEQRGLELESEVQSLRGELRGIRETLERLSPPPADPEPEPVPVPVPAPAPEVETVPAPAETNAAPKETKKSGGFWGPAYR